MSHIHEIKGCRRDCVFLHQFVCRIVQCLIQPDVKDRYTHLTNVHHASLVVQGIQDSLVKIDLHAVKKNHFLCVGKSADVTPPNQQERTGIPHKAAECILTALLTGESHCGNRAVALTWCKLPDKFIAIIQCF